MATSLKKCFSALLVLLLIIGNFGIISLAEDVAGDTQSFVMLNSCEEKGNLRPFGTTTMESSKVYEGEYSFGVICQGVGDDDWLLRSNGKGALDTFDVSAYRQNGGIRFMIYVDDVTKMGATYKFSLLSSGTTLSQYWKNENGTVTTTEDVGYVWKGDTIKSQITQNGWNEVVLPFASAQENIYVNGDVTTYPYSDGVELTEIYFRNYTPRRTTDVYIDSIMVVSSCTEFARTQVDGTMLSSLDINSSRYVEGDGALYLENVDEKSVGFSATDIAAYGDGYLRMNIFANSISSLPASGTIALQRSEELLAADFSKTIINEESYSESPSMFCATRTFEKAKFGYWSYKATTGVNDHECWMIRTTLDSPVDISSLTENGTSGTLRFWIYLDDISNLGDLVSGNVAPQVQFGEDWDTNVYVWNNWHTQITHTGWNEIVLNFADSAVKGTPTSESMNYFFIKTGNNSAKITAYIDNIHISADKTVQEFDISRLLSKVSDGWSEVALKLDQSLGVVDTFNIKAAVGVFDKVWIDSLCVMEYAGRDFYLESTAAEAPVDNVGLVSDLEFTVLTPCESADGFSDVAASADKVIEGTKSLFSDKSNTYILCSNANAPLKPFTYLADNSLLLYLYVDGEVSDIGTDMSVFVTNSDYTLSDIEDGNAAGYKWNSETVLSQCIYSNDWNVIVLPFSDAEKTGDFEQTHLTDIYISSLDRSVSVYTDLIALVNNHSFIENSLAFKQDTNYLLVDSFETSACSENVYHGAYSLGLTAGEEYSAQYNLSSLLPFENGGISFMLYSEEGILPDGTVQFAGITWDLKDCISWSEIKCGWNKIYLSFASGNGSLSGENTNVCVSAVSDLIIDQLVLLSGFGKTSKDIRVKVLSGDANADGCVNIIDLVRLKKTVADICKSDISAVDFNGSDSGDAYDLAVIRKMLLGLTVDLSPTAPEYTADLINTNDIVAVTDVITNGAKGDGVTDDTAAFKAALTVAGTTGGTVYVPFGEYLISENLTVPSGVKIAGEIRKDGSMPLIKVAVGTVSDGNDTPFISLNTGSAIQGFKIWYINQDFENGVVKEYPYTLKMTGFQSVTISDIELVNSYNGIDLSLSPHNLEVIRNVKGTILNVGMLWYGNNDSGRFESIVFSPQVWLQSGVENIPDSDFLVNYTKKHTVGVHIKSIDWHYVSDLVIKDCNIGILVDGGFGKFYKTNVINCNTGVLFNAVAKYGTTFTECKIKATHGTNPLAICLKANTSNGISLVGCTLSSDGNSVIGNYGLTAVTLTDCRVDTDNEGTFAIINDNGRIAANSTVFSGGGEVIRSEKGNTVSFASCDFGEMFPPECIGSSVTNVDGDTAELPEISSDSYALKTAPAQGSIVNACDFGVSTDDTDIAARLQAAIDSVAPTGGTVYVPKGDYYLQSPVTVKSGVTLLGSYDAPHYTSVLCTTFVTDYGKNDADGTALLTLEAGSAIRGFSVAYSETRLDGTPYAYTIRGTGSDIYIRNIAVDGAYRVLDLAGYRCDNHYVEYLLFSAIDTGISVGFGSENGVIRDCQSNPAGLWDNRFTERTYWLEEIGQTAVITSQIQTLKAYVVSDTVNQMLFMNFVYGSNIGVWLKGNANATIIGQGVDYSLNTVKLSDNANAVFADAQLSCSAGGSVALVADETYSGNAKVYNMTAWAVTANAVDVSGGSVAVCGGVFFQCGTHAVVASGGNTLICGVSLNNYSTAAYLLNGGAESFRAFGNLYKNGLTISNENNIKTEGGDFYE